MVDDAKPEGEMAGDEVAGDEMVDDAVAGDAMGNAATGGVERQLQAWADAVAPASGGAVSQDVVTLDDVTLDDVNPDEHALRRPTSTGSGRRRLAAVAAALVMVGAGAVAVVVTSDDDPETVRTGEPPATSEPTPTSEPSVGPGVGATTEVRFERLHVGLAGAEPPNTVRSAATEEQLAALWDDLIQLEEPTGEAGPMGPPPAVDFDEQVVVSFVIADDECGPWLDRFDRAGRQLTPVFVEPMDACQEETFMPKRYVAAIDWAAVEGDVMELHLPADEGLEAVSLQVRRGRTDPVTFDIELAGTTVAAGEEVPGTVIVNNTTGVPIEIGYCGAEFAVGLYSDDVDQSLAFADCLEGGTIPPGTSIYGVVVTASYHSCTATLSNPPGLVACRPGGGMPPLPPGEYRTRLYRPSGLLGEGTAPPVTVTITEA